MSAQLETHLYEKINDNKYKRILGSVEYLIPAHHIQHLQDGKLYYLLTQGCIIVDAVEKTE